MRQTGPAEQLLFHVEYCSGKAWVTKEPTPCYVSASSLLVAHAIPTRWSDRQSPPLPDFQLHARKLRARVFRARPSMRRERALRIIRAQRGRLVTWLLLHWFDFIFVCFRPGAPASRSSGALPGQEVFRDAPCEHHRGLVAVELFVLAAPSSELWAPASHLVAN